MTWRGVAWHGEAGGGGGVREGLFYSQAPIACERTSLIKRSNSSSTSGVGLNLAPPLAILHMGFEISEIAMGLAH